MQLLRTGSVGNANLLCVKTAVIRPSRSFVSVPQPLLFLGLSNSLGGSSLSGISATGERGLGFRGKRVGPAMAYSGNSVQKAEEEWRAILSPQQFYILRQKGTEYGL